MLVVLSPIEGTNSSLFAIGTVRKELKNDTLDSKFLQKRGSGTVAQVFSCEFSEISKN